MSVFVLLITSIAVGGAVKACGCCGHADTNDLSFPTALTQKMPGSFRDCINLPAGPFVIVSNSKHGGNVAERHSTTTHAVIEEMKKLATLYLCSNQISNTISSIVRNSKEKEVTHLSTHIHLNPSVTQN